MEHLSSFLENWSEPLLFGTSAYLLLAVVALPFMSLMALTAAINSKRSLYDRCARQLAGLVLALICFLLLCTGGLYSAGLVHAADPFPLFPGLCLIMGGLLAGGFLFWGICVRAWKNIRPHSFLLWLIGFCGWLCLVPIPLAGLLLARLDPTQLDPAQTDTMLFRNWEHIPQLVQPIIVGAIDEPLFILKAAGLLFLAGASGGGLALLWLVLRRKRDDFGRDYYTFAAKWCGKWAAAGSWVALGILAGAHWLAAGGTFPVIRMYSVETIGAGCLALAALLWTAISVSSLPMRYKPGMFLAAFCLLFTLICGASGSFYADFFPVEMFTHPGV